MIDLIALLFMLLTAVGFTLLAHALVAEFNPGLKAGYVVFYTMSFLFSSYILNIGPSWLNFLGNQSALPWLALGILDRKLFRGTGLVALFTLHEIFGAYAPSTLSNALLLTLFAGGIALVRRSPRPMLSWVAGQSLAVLLAAPLLVHMLDGFAHSARASGFSVASSSLYSIPAGRFFFSFFLGNWQELFASWLGNALPANTVFPSLASLPACARPGACCPRWRAAPRGAASSGFAWD